MNGQTQNNHPLEERPEGTLVATPREQPSEAAPTRKFKLTWQFVAGFLGWYLVTALVYWLGKAESACLFPVLFPVNLVMIIVLLKRQPRAGWGLLSALGLNLVISLILNLVINAICFIPFFTPMYW